MQKPEIARFLVQTVCVNKGANRLRVKKHVGVFNFNFLMIYPNITNLKLL